MAAYESLNELRKDLEGAIRHYRKELARFTPDYTRPSFKNDYPMPPTWQDFKCNHSNMLPRLWVLSNGVRRVALQCQACGERQDSGVRSADYPNFEQLPPFDEELREDARTAVHKALETLRRVRDEAMQAHDSRRQEMSEWEQLSANQEWWERYNRYLQTPEWRAKRERVLERDDHLCQACLKREATQAHHLTYKRVFSEPLFDLVGVCMVCHAALHPHMEKA